MRRLKPVLMLFLVLGSAAISLGSLEYFNDDEYAPFVLEKLPLPHEALWLGALKLHVASAAFALPGCLLLLSTFVQRRAPRFHRYLGRVTGVVTLLGLAPTGFYLSLFAKGGLPSTLGFMATGAITVWAMVKGIATARAKDFVQHRRFVAHVVAQMAVAVISRAMMLVLDGAGVAPEPAYLVSLWVPVLGCAAFVELFFNPQRSLHVPFTGFRLSHVAGSGLRRS